VWQAEAWWYVCWSFGMAGWGGIRVAGFIHPSSGACDFSIVSPHWLCVLVSMCVGISVWLVGGGIGVAG